MLLERSDRGHQYLAHTFHHTALLNLMTLLTKSRKLILDVVFLFIKTEAGPSFEDERILAYDDSEGEGDLKGGYESDGNSHA